MDKWGLDNFLFEGFEDEDGRRYVYLANLQTGISRWSKQAVEYFGMPGEYIENATDVWAEHVHPEDRDAYLADLAEVFSESKKIHRMDYRVKNKDGEYVVCTCRGKLLYAENGDRFFVGTIENHGLMDYIDSVTGLYNVYAFLRDARMYQKNEQKDLLLIMGVGHFSDINKIYGYGYGNRVLKRFAEELRHTVKSEDIVYRLDGIKFCIALKNGTEEQAEEIYATMKALAKSGFDMDDVHICFTLAGGVVMVDDKTISEYSIQASMDYVLDMSKYHKHGEFVAFSNHLLEDTNRNLAVMDAIRNSVFREMDGFYLCYQPIIDVASDSICGMEALLRWSKEPFGNVPPGVFIPWLENDPCFYDLGMWIFRQALLDAKKIISKHPDFVVNVNVSVEQIERTGFRQFVVELLKELDFSPSNLCIELTERVMSLDTAFLRGELAFFRGLGIKIALDDFGTGVSSLNLLLELPVDYLKIDRNFVKEISSNKAEQLIVETISLCAEGLALDICVEGVETQEMRDFLKRYHIQKHQGYFYSKPVEFDQFLALMKGA